MAKTGRPQKVIDKDEFEKMCEIQCTETEIAHVFRCSVDTVNRWCKRTYDKSFAEVYKIYSADGKKALRRIQLDLAQKSAAMAIFLGKQWLGQRDTPEPVGDANDLLTALSQIVIKGQSDDSALE